MHLLHFSDNLPLYTKLYTNLYAPVMGRQLGLQMHLRTGHMSSSRLDRVVTNRA